MALILREYCLSYDTVTEWHKIFTDGYESINYKPYSSQVNIPWSK